MNSTKGLRKKISLVIRKDRSVSFFDIFKFIFNFLILYIPFWAAIFFPLHLGMKSGEYLTYGQWMIIFILPFGLVIISYFREYIVTHKREKKLRRDIVIFSCIASAIKLITLQDFQNKSSKNEFVKDLLSYFHRVIDVILSEEGIPMGTICSNLMIYYDNPEKLVLEHIGFYTAGHGEEKFTLPIDRENPLSGAPAAFVNDKTIYIDDTESEKYSKYFLTEDNWNVKSFISLPIRDTNKKVFAILNIDSDIAQQFISTDFISKSILPRIYIFILFLRLGCKFYGNCKK